MSDGVRNIILIVVGIQFLLFTYISSDFHFEFVWDKHKASLIESVADFADGFIGTYNGIKKIR